MGRARAQRWISNLALVGLLAAGSWAGLVPVATAQEVLTDLVDEVLDEPVSEPTSEPTLDPDTTLDDTVETLGHAAQDPIGTVRRVVEAPTTVVEGSSDDAEDVAPPQDEDQAEDEGDQTAAEDGAEEGGSDDDYRPAARAEVAAEQRQDHGPQRREPVLPARLVSLDDLPLAMFDPQTRNGLGGRGSANLEFAFGPPSFLLANPPGLDIQLGRPVQAGPRSSADVVDVLESVNAFPSVVAGILAPFPVAGPATYDDDWGAPRHDPHPHPHQGTDIFAPRGTAVIASADGVVTNLRRDTAIGGNSLRVTTSDGTFFYYAHLDGFAPGIGEGTLVRRGAVLGFVGTSGNATNTPPHLHYEIHPRGTGPVPPVPYLDRWLADARVAAQQYAQAVGGPPAPEVAPSADAPLATGGAAAVPSQSAPAGAADAALDGLASSEQAVSPLSLLILLAVAVLFVLLFNGTRRSVVPVPAVAGAAVPAPPAPPADLLVAAGLVPAAAEIEFPGRPRREPRRASFDPLPLDRETEREPAVSAR